ncbi:MAG: hypothetical protein JXA24_06015 [Proteobacteria bacterium]|nr:hypothetical protein [Pseudomonadota bacterium]
MTRILPLHASNFFMAPAGAPPGGIGNGGQAPAAQRPSGAPAQAARSAQVHDLRRAVNTLHGAADAVTEHVAWLERQLDGERSRAGEFEEGARALQQQLEMERTQREDLARERAGLEALLAEQRSRLDGALEQLSDAEEISAQLQQSADRAAAVLAGAAEMLTGLADSLGPIFGAASPVVTQMRQRAEAMAVSAGSVSSESARLAELAGLIASGEAHAAWLTPWTGRRGAPSLLERSKDDADAMSRGLFSSIFDSLSTIFENMNTEAVTERLNAFMEAAAFLLGQDGTEGAQRMALNAISRLIAAEVPARERRGSFYEVVRSAGLMMEGRKFDRLSASMPRVSFLGWRFDGTGFRAEHLNTESEIDAMEGRTLVEFKAVNLAGAIGNYLAQMLRNTGSEGATVFRTRSEIASGKFDAGYVVKVANQMIRYRQLMDSGHASALELHLTSQTAMPRDVVNAIHEFFGAERLRIFHYADALTRRGVLLTPGSQPTANGTAAPEAAAFPQAAAVVVEKQAHPADRPPPTREEAQAAIYQSSLIMSEAGFNTATIEQFISWIVDEPARAEAFAQEAPESLQSHLLDQFRRWQAEQDGADDGDAEAPWLDVETERAQKRFNRLYDTIIRKDVSPDWGQRVTQGVQNTDVMKILAWIKDQQIVVDDDVTGINDMASDLIVRLKETYKPESYFKLDVDGDAVIEIMRRFIWLSE